jgi:hypothetical protein
MRKPREIRSMRIGCVERSSTGTHSHAAIRARSRRGAGVADRPKWIDLGDSSTTPVTENTIRQSPLLGRDRSPQTAPCVWRGPCSGNALTCRREGASLRRESPLRWAGNPPVRGVGARRTSGAY